MNQPEAYRITIDGVVYDVLVACEMPVSKYYDPGPIIQSPAQAAWVTTRRIDHLPPH